MAEPGLSILHVMRAPIGGLFRHVCDLAEGQIARGHRVGIACADTHASEQAEARLKALAPALALGLHRIAMPRIPGIGDYRATRAVSGLATETAPDILHGHGAKGGAYARLAAAPGDPLRVYTPHGGSLHYAPASPAGMVFMAMERTLARRTGLFLFESDYSRRVFDSRVTRTGERGRVVHNGIGEADLAPVKPASDAADILFVGELRMLKGVDVLIEAMAICGRRGETPSALIVGSGPDRDRFIKQAEAAGLKGKIAFPGAMPARRAFALGRLAVVPSRAESLPYIVLELAGAGVPMIATDVGGIGEIFGEQRGRLVPPGDAEALADAMLTALGDIRAARSDAARLRAGVARAFSLDGMVEQVTGAYSAALAARDPGRD
ncbi:MAG: glycosyltransferase [Flavobacteriaceae bacterium]